MFPQFRKALFGALATAIVITVVLAVPAAAQCPLCRLAVENSSQASSMGRGLNLGILVLLIPPVSIFCSIFFLAFKQRKIRKA
jgi:hypothetical protein